MVLLKAAIAAVILPTLDELDAIDKGDLAATDKAMENVIGRLELLGYHFHRDIDHGEALSRLSAVLDIYEEENPTKKADQSAPIH